MLIILHLFKYAYNNNNNNIHICIAPYGLNFRGAKAQGTFAMRTPTEDDISDI